MYRLRLRYLSTMVVLLCALYYMIKTNSEAMAINTTINIIENTEDGSISNEETMNNCFPTRSKSNVSVVSSPHSILITEIYHGINSIALDKENESGTYIISEVPHQPYDKLKYISDISFFSCDREPYVRIANGDVSFGVGSKGFLIPMNVYEFLPKEIIVIGMYEMDDRIILQRKPGILPPWMYLDLEDIGLSKKEEKRLKYSESKIVTLEIVQTYELRYPQELNLVDDRKDLLDTIIQIPFKFQYTVND